MISFTIDTGSMTKQDAAALRAIADAYYPQNSFEIATAVIVNPTVTPSDPERDAANGRTFAFGRKMPEPTLAEQFKASVEGTAARVGGKATVIDPADNPAVGAPDQHALADQVFSGGAVPTSEPLVMPGVHMAAGELTLTSPVILDSNGGIMAAGATLYDVGIQPGSPEFDGAAAYEAHLERTSGEPDPAQVFSGGAYATGGEIPAGSIPTHIVGATPSETTIPPNVQSGPQKNAVISLYKWSDSLPEFNPGDAYFNWNSAAIDKAVPGWSVMAPPNPNAPGQTLYIATSVLQVPADTIASPLAQGATTVAAVAVQGATVPNVQSGAPTPPPLPPATQQTLPPPSNDAPIGSLPPPPPPVPEQASASAGAPTTPPVQTDAAGLPWDARIHAGTKTMTAKGVWTRRRAIEDSTVAEVEAQLRAAMAIPASANPWPFPKDSSSVGGAATPPPPADGPPTFGTLMTFITERVGAGTLTSAQVTTAVQATGLETINVVMARPDLIPAIMVELKKVAP